MPYFICISMQLNNFDPILMRFALNRCSEIGSISNVTGAPICYQKISVGNHEVEFARDLGQRADARTVREGRNGGCANECPCPVAHRHFCPRFAITIHEDCMCLCNLPLARVSWLPDTATHLQYTHTHAHTRTPNALMSISWIVQFCEQTEEGLYMCEWILPLTISALPPPIKAASFLPANLTPPSLLQQHWLSRSPVRKIEAEKLASWQSDRELTGKTKPPVVLRAWFRGELTHPATVAPCSFSLSRSLSLSLSFPLPSPHSWIRDWFTCLPAPLRSLGLLCGWPDLGKKRRKS